jgi:serine/threonine-protein kinase
MARDLLPLVREALTQDYSVEREIGRGGAARVFLAHAPDGTPVALKVLHPELQVSTTADRFLREIRLVSQLQHRLIAPVLDSGQRGYFVYYVMPMIQGPTLRECLARARRLSLDDSLRVARDLLDALAHAHERHIVHRDVKPENVIISSEGAVLLDFGVARGLEAAANDRVTATGMSVGSAGYMSPEQATAAQDLDLRTDIYAVGCVLFECLAGRPPFAHRNMNVVLQMQMAGESPDVRTFRGDVPPEVAEAVTRALQRDRNLRWKTAREMGEALDLEVGSGK